MSSFTVSDINNRLTESCGNRLLQNDFEQTVREIKVSPQARLGTDVSPFSESYVDG